MEKTTSNGPWFSNPAPDDDVILSTRIRLARNLADFPFASKMTEDDKNRVTSLVYDVISKDESFLYKDFSQISGYGRSFFAEEGIIKNDNCTAFALSKDESLSVLINDREHVRIAGFATGLSCEKVMQKVYKIDEQLQNNLQFAANCKYGYLTSNFKDCGSGMKISLYCFVPGIILSGKFIELNYFCESHGCSLEGVFYNHFSFGDSNRFIYRLETKCAAKETEFDQMAAIQSVGMYILNQERKIRTEYADNNPTMALNFVKQAVSKAVASLLLSYEDGVFAICGIKWGLHTGILTGVDVKEINQLYYETRNGHIKYLCDNFSFDFEPDVKENEVLKVQRLRAVTIQQAIEKLDFSK